MMDRILQRRFTANIHAELKDWEAKIKLYQDASKDLIPEKIRVGVVMGNIDDHRSRSICT